jgi:16S rRNA (cytidine1402-2'-O)-methyltransferase
MPVLYLVATPIGNLEDISPRALRTLREVSLIACEDTRRTRQLLNSFDIHKPLTSYNEHNKKEKTGLILKKLSEGDVALVSDGGMPAISDPGREMVTAASQSGFNVCVIPGPSALTTALAASGLMADRFVFLGFPPHRAGERRRLLETYRYETTTLVIHEAPHRLQKTLADMLTILGDRNLAVCRELTKMYEEIFYGTVSQAQTHFLEPRGEFTLVCEGGFSDKITEITEDIYARLEKIRASGASAKDAVAEISAATGLPRRQIYRAWLSRENKN